MNPKLDLKGLHNRIGSCEYVCLIPFGSASEKTCGLCHLYEHLILSKYYSRGVKAGVTTEDYIMFFLDNTPPHEFTLMMKEHSFTQASIKSEKKALYSEIAATLDSKNERYFGAVWRETFYDKSPMGDASEIEKISVKDMQDFKKNIIGMPMLTYDNKENITIENTPLPEKRIKAASMEKKSIIFDNLKYQIYFFKDEIVLMLVLVHILKILNPYLHLQISEKKEMSALIMEKSTIVPCKHEIERHIGPARKAIQGFYDELKGLEKAAAELECLLFYNERLAVKKEKIGKVSREDILWMAEKLIGLS